VKELLLHIAFGNQLLLHIANDAPAMDDLRKQIDENSKGEAAAVTKQQVLETLADSFKIVRKTLEAERAAGLNRNVDFFGTATTRRGVFTSLDTHMAEHEGQLIAYARVNGIAPPWSVAAK
jgi:hypothetical protein